MNSRERLFAVLRGEKPNKYIDRVPYSPLLDGYFMSSRPPGTDILDVYKEIGADALVRHVSTYGWNFFAPRDRTERRRFLKEGIATFEEQGVRITNKIEPHPKGRMFSKTYEIPGRTLTAQSIFNEKSPYIPFPVKRLINTVEDLKAYEYIVKRIEFFPVYNRFVEEDRKIGDLGIGTDSGQISPIQDLLMHHIGIEAFYTRFFTDHLPELESLMKTMHEKNLEAYELMAASPAEVIIAYENTSTSFISPAIYKKYSSPCINDYADILHEKKKIFLTHRCGLLKGLVDILKEERDDGIADISPPPTGNLSIWEAQEALPNKVVIGGIDATFLAGWPVESVKAYAREALKRSPDIGRMILGSADAVPLDAKMENLKAIGQVVREV